jgi:hypothetical protein
VSGVFEVLELLCWLLGSTDGMTLNLPLTHFDALEPVNRDRGWSTCNDSDKACSTTVLCLLGCAA